MFEKADKGEGRKAFVVGLVNRLSEKSENHSLTEMQSLAASAGFTVSGSASLKLNKPTPRTFLGSGKAEILAAKIHDTESDCAVLDREITPSQQYNLSQLLGVTVYTKNEIIHLIFASHAKTAEGKIKVELADLRYRLSRLPGKGNELSRTGAGIGTRGPGEQQIESSRRFIKDRISLLTRRLKQITRRRKLNKSLRYQKGFPQVAIVGYTNAGKSTILNALTGSHETVQDKLFATLHPAARQTFIAGIGETVFSDTVGFIREMPPTLKDAFRATMEEVLDADLILQVIDASDPAFSIHYQVIIQTLREIGAMGTPAIAVFNKIDTLVEPFHVPPEITKHHPHVFVSAKKGYGLQGLIDEIVQQLEKKISQVDIVTDYHNLPEIEKDIYRNGYIEDMKPVNDKKVRVRGIVRKH